ncbi:MAG TPA: hypothetical protein VK787_08845 [Puia sp.]|jgi:hypothetical protein|nr:hypothetical protein [Puia sp.]
MPNWKDVGIQAIKYLGQSVGIVVLLYVAEKYFDMTFAATRLKQENFINAKKMLISKQFKSQIK